MTTSTFRIGTRRLSSPEQCYLDQVWSKWGFRGISLPTWGGSINETPKTHTLTWVRVVWAIKHKNPSTGLTCRWVHKKMYKWKKISIIFHPFAQKQSWTDLHQIWHGCRGCRCNHLNQIFWWSVKGGGFCGGSKIALSHWQSQSPLTQGWRNSHHTYRSRSWWVRCAEWRWCQWWGCRESREVHSCASNWNSHTASTHKHNISLLHDTQCISLLDYDQLFQTSTNCH